MPKKRSTWKLIYYGNYEINRQGTIRRKTPAQGTYVGRILHPFPAEYGNGGWVHLCRGNGHERKLFNVELLRKRAFKK